MKELLEIGVLPRGLFFPLQKIKILFICSGSELVRRAIAEMVNRGCEEVMLEAEVTNAGALRLYANLGFIRDKRLQR